MKHLTQYKLFESKQIEQIINIARDEGLSITMPGDAIMNGWTYGIYIEKYKQDQYGSALIQEDPVVENKEFIRIIKDIYTRLDNEGLINDYKQHNNSRFIAVHGLIIGNIMSV